MERKQVFLSRGLDTGRNLCLFDLSPCGEPFLIRNG
jgi:hypothetical protein